MAPGPACGTQPLWSAQPPTDALLRAVVATPCRRFARQSVRAAPHVSGAGRRRTRRRPRPLLARPARPTRPARPPCPGGRPTPAARPSRASRASSARLPSTGVADSAEYRSRLTFLRTSCRATSRSGRIGSVRRLRGAPDPPRITLEDRGQDGVGPPLGLGSEGRGLDDSVERPDQAPVPFGRHGLLRGVVADAVRLVQVTVDALTQRRRRRPGGLVELVVDQRVEVAAQHLEVAGIPQ